MILLQNVWKCLNHFWGQGTRRTSGRRLGPPVAVLEGGRQGGGGRREEEEEEARKKKQNLHTG